MTVFGKITCQFLGQGFLLENLSWDLSLRIRLFQILSRKIIGFWNWQYFELSAVFWKLFGAVLKSYPTIFKNNGSIEISDCGLLRCISWLVRPYSCRKKLLTSGKVKFVFFRNRFWFSKFQSEIDGSYYGAGCESFDAQAATSFFENILWFK